MKYLFPKYKKLKLLTFDLKSKNYIKNKSFKKFKKFFGKIYKDHFFLISNNIKNNIDCTIYNTLEYQHSLYPINFYPKIYELQELEVKNLHKLDKDFHKNFKFKNFKYKLNKSLLYNLSKFNLRKTHVFIQLENIERRLNFNSSKTLYYKNLQNIRRLRIFYGLISYSEIKRLVKKSEKKRIGAYSYFFMLLESRLDIILYRLNFFDTIKEIKIFLKKGLIKIYRNNIMNDYLIFKNPMYRLHLNDIFSIDKNLRFYFYKLFLKRLYNNNKVYNIPSYIEVNYKMFIGLFNYKLYNADNVPYYFEANPKIFYLLYVNRLR